MGEKPVKNDEGLLSLDEDAKKEAWKEHYERLLNVEFPWNPEDLSVESPVEGPSEPITLEMITKAINKMASGKAAGPSGCSSVPNNFTFCHIGDFGINTNSSFHNFLLLLTILTFHISTIYFISLYNFTLTQLYFYCTILA